MILRRSTLITVQRPLEEQFQQGYQSDLADVEFDQCLRQPRGETVKTLGTRDRNVSPLVKRRELKSQIGLPEETAR